MSIILLTEAASEMRRAWEWEHADPAEAEFYLAVADWLDADAERVERNRLAVTFDGSPMFPPNPNALAVARAYLGTL